MNTTRCMSLVMEDDVAYLLLKFGVEDFAGCPPTPVPADYADDGAGRSRPDYTILTTTSDAFYIVDC